MNQKRLKTALLFLLASLTLLSACQRSHFSAEQGRAKLQQLKDKSRDPEITPESLTELAEQALNLMDEVVDPFDQAQILVDQAERDFVFESFDEGVTMFEMALQKDAGNEKALAYLSILYPLSNFKGLFWRLQGEQIPVEAMEAWISSALFSPKLDERHMTLFMIIPHGSLLANDVDIQEKLFRPFSLDLKKSYQLLDRLKGNHGLDVTLSLPKALSPRNRARIRSADAEALSRFNIGISFYVRGFLSFTPSQKTKLLGNNDFKEGAIDRWERERLVFWKDPKAGLLKDLNFYADMRNQIPDIIQGLQMVYDLMKKRLEDDQNSLHDFFQYTTFRSPYYNLENLFPAGPNPPPPVFTLPNDRIALEPAEIEKTAPELVYNRYYEFHRKGESSSYVANSKALKDIKDTLSGPVERELSCEVDGKEHVVKSWIDLPGYLNNPFKNVRETKINWTEETGEIMEMPDPTFRGLFPNGDFPCLELSKKNAKEKGYHPVL